MALLEQHVRIIELSAECKAMLHHKGVPDNRAVFLQRRRAIWYLLDFIWAVGWKVVQTFLVIFMTGVIVACVVFTIRDGLDWNFLLGAFAAALMLWVNFFVQSGSVDNVYRVYDTAAVFWYGWYRKGWFRAGDHIMIRRLREYVALTPAGARLELRAHYHRKLSFWSLMHSEVKRNIAPEDLPAQMEKFPNGFVLFDLFADGKFFAASFFPVPPREATQVPERLGVPWTKPRSLPQRCVR